MTYSENNVNQSPESGGFNRRYKSRLGLTAAVIALVLLTALYMCLDTRLVALRTENPAYPAGTSEISLVWTNNMLRPIWEAQYFRLERLVDGKWQRLELKFGVMLCVVTFSPVSPFGKAAERWKLDIYQPSPLPAGQYRVAGEFALSPAPYETITVYAEFYLQQEA